MWSASAADMNAGLANLAADGLLFMVVFFAGTCVTWWAVGGLRWEQFVSDPHGPQARLLRFILALCGGLVFGLVALGYVAAVQSLRTAL
ncbi:MAG: DUF1146 domain-containing protein [Alicyclobacillaceae bacterium]|nr:DUF1146 domain-containing protein [Alicyclobacillaceae bacterium]